jgi:hypothetical protein
MPARTAVHIARWSSDHVMPSPRGDTGEDGMSWRSHTRPESRASGMARGRLPSLAVQHREVDCGYGVSPRRHTGGNSPPDPDCRLSTGGERSRTIADWRFGRGAPPWLAVQHREVDVGYEARGAPTRSRSHPECSEGSAIVDQILRADKSALKMTDGRGNGPPWLCVRHHEVDVGSRSPSLVKAVGCSPPDRNCELSTRGERSRTNANCQLTISDTPFGTELLREPGEGYAHTRVWFSVERTAPMPFRRARESIARLMVRNTSNLPKVNMHAKATFGRCRLVSFFVSDAAHEFPRIRSAGSVPMISFRRSGFPQLLLMQPSLLRGREVDEHTKKAFS